jgi:AraC-like DNA-binding protein
MVLIVIGVLPGHKGRIGHHDHTHFIGQTRRDRCHHRRVRIETALVREIGGKLHSRPLEAQIAALAARQHGVVSRGQRHDWTSLALDLGYVDHAHFIHDFRAAVGRSPSEYEAQCAALAAA